MPKQGNHTNEAGGAAKAVVLVMLILAVLAGALYAGYEFYGKDKFSAYVDPAKDKASEYISTVQNKVSEYIGIVQNKISKTPPNEAAKETADAKKHEKPGAGDGEGKDSSGGVGGKSVKDVLGGPEFTGGKAPAQQVSLRGNAPEPPAKTPPAAQTPTPEVEAVPPPQSMPLPPPPPNRQLPSFPKTNMPTLNFTVELPQSKASQPVASAKPAPSQSSPAPTPQPAPPPPPPPPPPKPGAKLTLSNVSGHLSDRPDINVSMSIDLMYEADKALREELEFKKDMLSTVASSVLRKHEYGTVNAATLKKDILIAFNEHIQSGKLSDVEVKDFQIGQSISKR